MLGLGPEQGDLVFGDDAFAAARRILHPVLEIPVLLGKEARDLVSAEEILFDVLRLGLSGAAHQRHALPDSKLMLPRYAMGHCVHIRSPTKTSYFHTEPLNLFIGECKRSGAALGRPARIFRQF